MAWTLTQVATGLMALACLVAAAVIDVRRRIIPNALVLGVMAAGLVLRLLATPGAIWLSIVIWTGTLLVLGLLAAREMLGWGDVKMIAAVTLLVPPQGVLSLLPAIVIAGGALACATLLARRAGAIAPDGAGRWRQMPYAVAILGGVAYHGAVTALRCLSATSCS